MRMQHLICALALSVLLTATAESQSPIDVQRHAANGEYLEALSTYDQLPKRIVTTATVIAAAKSAWALGLPDRAITEFDKALRDGQIDDAERGRIYLSRGIIEYQETRYQVSILYSERAVGYMPTPSPLRAKAWLLWGQSLDQLGLYAAAEEKYHKAADEGDTSDLGEIHYLLGSCQLRLGKSDDARKNFEQVPLRHERTPQAVRQLAQIALDSSKYVQAEFWLKKGRTEYPDSFLDSWVDYGLAKVAISKDDESLATGVLDDARKKYPPSDYWFNLTSAAVESYRFVRVSGGDMRASFGKAAVEPMAEPHPGESPKQESLPLADSDQLSN